jgi:hypothetical protein
MTISPDDSINIALFAKIFIFFEVAPMLNGTEQTTRITQTKSMVMRK